MFQIRNLHPDTGTPITISDAADALASYTGNAVANAQAFVAKAKANGEFESSHLDVSRLNIPGTVLAWVEGEDGSATLADIGVSYLCNGDSMFHVNKGVIAFKMDAARNVRMTDTSATDLVNLGASGSSLCGDYLNGRSHPQATLLGYGGAAVRGYTVSGSEDVIVTRSSATDLRSIAGSAIGFDILTDSSDIQLIGASVDGANAGAAAGGPTPNPEAIGFHVAAGAKSVLLLGATATGLVGAGGTAIVDDESGAAAEEIQPPDTGSGGLDRVSRGAASSWLYAWELLAMSAALLLLGSPVAIASARSAGQARRK